MRAACPQGGGADAKQGSTPAHASEKDLEELHAEQHEGQHQLQHGVGEAREVAVPMEQEAPTEPAERPPRTCPHTARP